MVHREWQRGHIAERVRTRPPRSRHPLRPHQDLHPWANFMMLDEPSAACDQDRTNAMLGYIASSGFGQVLLVTHNEQSESFAHNLIQL